MKNTELFKNRFLKARRNWLNHYFENLNSMQREAVLATEGPVLILAGAGSGKTTVLIRRIENLLSFGAASDSQNLPADADELSLSALESLSEEAREYVPLLPVAPWKILAITFTNKAAEELKSRLSILLGESAEDIWACTFHSACVRILRRDAEQLGYGNNFNIYDTSDSQSLMKHILKEYNLDEKVFPIRSVLSEISKAKDRKVLPEEYAKSAQFQKDFRKQRIAELYAEYSRRLFSANAMDFDDLILNTVLLLEKNEPSREYWQNRFSYIMVDEYQDTNHLQYELVSLLSAAHRNLCVVGDDDQSIYRFRGATIDNILSFEKQFPGCRTIRLEQNYRSTEQILDAANRVIQHNSGRKGKELWTSLGRGDPVCLLTANDENEEAAQIANRILTGFSQGKNWNEHAVLYRMNAQSRSIEFAFKRAGIPYRVIGGARFFDRAEVKDILSYLCVVSDTRDELRLLRIINNPPRGIGEKSVETALSLSRRDQRSLFDVFEYADDYPELLRSAVRMREFAAMIRQLQEIKNNCNALLDAVLDRTGYLSMLNNSKDERDQSRIENVQELKSSILAFQQQSGDDSLEGYLESIALYTDIDSMNSDENSVVMMTIHSAKGLEFPVVFVVGMEEGIFPGLRSIGDQDEMEEERRLCYVAFTRAKKNLTVTNARHRMLFGRTTANLPSRFLREAGLIEEESVQRVNPFQNSTAASFSFRSSSRRPERPARPAPPSAPAPTPELILSLGDRVRHKAFGDGTIIKLTPMGGDQLLEIEFDSTGKKKLMYRAAVKYLTRC
ncbi:MAG: UvrD-helicase domain-containing protein [Oscillospiraceae bacterium]|nr:UvrD-helicase domain-containing protein [Oscillospiraceae bacterium]MBR0393067.1 UvrD-helicase domain-containing protein [Oscillospiraceae bacterium]